MADDGRVVTAKLPDDLVDRMDQVADRIERTKSWIVREAVSQWLAEEQRRYELTLEGLKDFDEGRVISQDEVLEIVGNVKKNGVMRERNLQHESHLVADGSRLTLTDSTISLRIMSLMTADAAMSHLRRPQDVTPGLSETGIPC